MRRSGRRRPESPVRGSRGNTVAQESPDPARVGAMAKAYWITCYREVLDPAKLAAYARLAGPAIEAGGGRFIVRGIAAKAYEAGPVGAHRRHRIRYDRARDGCARQCRISSGPCSPSRRCRAGRAHRSRRLVGVRRSRSTPMPVNSWRRVQLHRRLACATADNLGALSSHRLAARAPTMVARASWLAAARVAFTIMPRCVEYCTRRGYWSA